MRTLYIHIGSHKTGTKSIQKSLVKNMQFLAENGISLFDQSTEGESRNTGNIHPWVKSGLNEGENAGAVDGLSEKLQQRTGDVLISCEIFSYFFEQKTIQKFIGSLDSVFDVIKVIVYVRRQDKMAISHHQQGSKQKDTHESQFYGTREQALPEYNRRLDQYLDYHQRLGYWADVIGDKNMIIRVFEEDSLYKKDAVKDFFHVLGLEPRHQVEKENESNGFIRTKVGHLMNQIGMPVTKSDYISNYLENSGKLLPKKLEAKEFYGHYRNSNMQLNRRFGIAEPLAVFDDDFDNYSDEPGDVWSECTANQAVLNILSAVKEMPTLNERDGKMVIAASQLLEENDNELATGLKGPADSSPVGQKMLFKDKLIRALKKVIPE